MKSCWSSSRPSLLPSPDRLLHFQSSSANSKVFMTAKSRAGKMSRKAAMGKAAAVKSKAGKLPEWNLSDFIPASMQLKSSAICKRWMQIASRLRRITKASSPTCTRKRRRRQWLAEAVKRYEAIDDLAGRLGSYAGLVHAGDSVDPAISKFYGDVSERLTAASTHLLFFALELNRVDDAVIERAMQTPALGHYRPWLEDLRKDKPYQLEDRVEQLFTRNPRAVIPPGTGCLTRPSPACASRSAARNSRSSRR